MSWHKTTAGDSQKTMATIFFTVLDYFLFPVIFFLVHAPVSMGILDGCAVFNVSRYISFLFRGGLLQAAPTVFGFAVCFFLLCSMHTGLSLGACSVYPFLSKHFGSSTLLNDPPHCGLCPTGFCHVPFAFGFFFWLCALS